MVGLRRNLWLGWVLLAGVVSVGLGGCRSRPQAVRPVVLRTSPPAVALRVYALVDDEFEERFGPGQEAVRAVVNDWLWRCEEQFGRGFASRPVAISLVGLGRWQVTKGALDGHVFWQAAQTKTWPEGCGANCLIAFTGRRGVCWSGISRWPRLYAKAQEHQPVDVNTVSLLVHEMSHWFGAQDIIDAQLPEASVMNYEDAHDGWREGRICWDAANRKRIEAGLSAWPAS